MNLPKTDVPIFETTLPISGSKIKFRPYLVKEQKIFLIALEGGDKNSMMQALTTVMDSCIISPENLKTGDLPLLDFEYLYLQMRCKSVKNTVELTFRCKKEKEDGSLCDSLVGIPLDLYDIKVPEIKKNANDIIINENPKMGVRLKYPSYNLMNSFGDTFSYESTSELIKKSIDIVYDPAQVYTRDLYTEAEMNEWFDCLNQQQYDKLLEFFNNLPVLKHDLKFKCKRCGYETDIHLEGIASFFG